MKRALRIVVADDEPELRSYYEEILPHIGHEVVGVAKTGQELVDHCATAKPDLIITDIKMPDMDGIEAALRIWKAQPTPVILVSAFYSQEFLDRAGAEPIMAYLTKPTKQPDLETSIIVAMQRFTEFQHLLQEANDLRQSLEQRKIVERAKGVLMKRGNLDEPAAFRRLQKMAMNKNKKLIEVAQMILVAEEALAAE